MVAVSVALPSSVRVALPLRSPPNVITGDLFMVVALEISPPFISTVLRTGAVRVLFVSVCVPVSVVTVLSMFSVMVLPDPTDVRPVPPAIVSVSLSKSIESAPPESP